MKNKTHRKHVLHSHLYLVYEKSTVLPHHTLAHGVHALAS